MERGSKVAIYKLKKVEPPKGEPFFLCTVLEKVYNNKNPYNKWETVFYEAYIFDTTLDLEPAEFTLNKDKDKYHFSNIANPQKSIIRVLDFRYENHTVWNGLTQQKEADGITPKIKRLFYLTRVSTKQTKFVSEDTQIKQLNKRIAELSKENSEIRAKNRALRNDLKKRSKIILEKERVASRAKKELKDITEPKIKKEKHFNELEGVYFNDM